MAASSGAGGAGVAAGCAVNSYRALMGWRGLPMNTSAVSRSECALEDRLREDSDGRLGFGGFAGAGGGTRVRAGDEG